MSDEPLTECPVCGRAIRRVVNSVGVVFKGSGFYVTDNRNGAGSGKAEAGPAKSSKESGEGTKSEGAKSEGAKKSEGARSEKDSGKKEGKAAASGAAA